MRPVKAKILSILLILLFNFIVVSTIFVLYFEIISHFDLEGNSTLLGKFLSLIMGASFLIPIWFNRKIKGKIVCKTERDRKLYDQMYGIENKILIVCSVFFIIMGILIK